ncbi:MAG: HD domain-containing phosphohydrolase [Candidatus Cloacimonadota bacterium]|nr:HD domain-containing phosphohydrolase [Candidatus Cloacimonadota bacterium]
MKRKIIYIGSNQEIEKKLRKVVKSFISENKILVEFSSVSHYKDFMKISHEKTVLIPVFDYLGFNNYQDILSIAIRKKDIFPYIMIIYKINRVRSEEISFNRFFLLLSGAPQVLWKNEISRLLNQIETDRSINKNKNELTIAHEIIIDKDKTIYFYKKNAKTIQSQLNDNLRNAYDFYIRLVEMTDYLLYAHSMDVKQISVYIAEELNLSKSEISEINYAASLHDIGKLALSDEINSKRIIELSVDQKILYEQHPALATYMLESVKGTESSDKIVLDIAHHHEKFNGIGFPDKLKGKEIPIGSRIIYIADYFSNQYRINKNMDADEVFAEMKQYHYQEFDEQLLDLLSHYVSQLKKGKPEEKFLIQLHQMKVGMVVADDVYTKKGLMLIKANTTLTVQLISKVVKYSTFDPILPGIYIKP